MPSPDLGRELRAHAPTASVELRERVLAIPVHAEAPRPAPRRRLALAALVAALVAAAAIAALVELVSSPSRPTAAPVTNPTTDLRRAPIASAESGGGAAGAKGYSPKVAPPAAAPARGRLQNVDAYLRLRVADVAALTRVTKRAQALARGYGGFVRSVDYEAGGRSGTADLALRVPVGRVQEAVARLEQLGTVLSQRVATSDAQAGVDDLTRRIESLRRQRAALRAQLRDATLTPAARTALQLRVARVERELPALARERAQASAHARLATIDLELLTARKQATPPPPPPGRFDRALREVAHVLEREAIVILYVVAFAAPFGLVYAAARGLRRRGDRRLLA